MRYRKLRIAWAVAWGVEAVLLIALWVRSYWRNDILTIKPPEVRYVVDSALGRTDFYYEPRAQRTWDYVEPWTIQAGEIEKYFEPALSDREANYHRYGVLAARFYFEGGTEGISVSFPTLYLTCLAIGIAAAPWIIAVRRFSLRALLIATTLVAVGLGLIVGLGSR